MQVSQAHRYLGALCATTHMYPFFEKSNSYLACTKSKLYLQGPWDFDFELNVAKYILIFSSTRLMSERSF